MSDPATSSQPPHPIYGLVEEASMPWWWILAGIVAVLLAAWLGRRLWRRWQQRPVASEVASAPMTPKIVLSPWQRLEALRVSAPFDGPEQRYFSFELSEILRQGIEQATGKPARDKTTQEIELSLPRVWRWQDDLAGKYLGLLRELDAVKYADRPLSLMHANDLIAQSREWVQRFSQKEGTPRWGVPISSSEPTGCPHPEEVTR